jgi:DNA helicase-2/ATP-dependent DNA helicase PcrA
MSEPVEKGSPSDAIIAEEEQLHARVQLRVAAGPEGIDEHASAEDFDRELIELRDAIAEAKPEDLAPLVEQMTRLAAIRSRLGGSKQLPVDPDSPYFAHMVLHEGEKVRDVLIGKRGFIDRKNNVQIVDWRNAPISQIYYRYDEGDDYDELIGGRELSGLVEKRRNVSIQKAVLRRIGTPEGTFVRDGQGQWHEASGSAAPVLQGGSGKVHHEDLHRADKHLPEIAALIDKEQFELITQPESGMVVIQGGAGSGKTTGALHRIAYLNFADGQRYRGNRMLFVVPSAALVRYVQAVLPALGVGGVPVVTYVGWARSTRQKLLRGSGGKYSDHTPDTVSRVKKHPLMLKVLDDYVAEQVAEVEEELESLGEGGHAIVDEWRGLSKQALVPRLRALYRFVGKAGFAPELRVAAESRIKTLGRSSNDILEDWAEIMTDAERLWRTFEGSDVRRGEIDATVKWCTDQQIDEDGGEAIGSDGSPISTVDGRAIDEGSHAGCYDIEDDPILLRLIQLKRGALVSRDVKSIRYSHVAIDEAQDRSALEVKVLLEATEHERGFPGRRSVTIAGDTAQRLVFDNNFSGWEDLLSQTGNASVTVRPLKLSYRSTAEVMALAREVLGPELAPKEELVARSGAPVELHQFGDPGEAVAFLADALRALMGNEPTASVALIARYPEQADAYYAGLSRAEVPKMRRVRRHDFSFAAGIDVTDASQVKGLEFDYVIMLDVNDGVYPANVESRHLIHIVATRAAHQLWLISTAEPSPLMPSSLRMF